jgi:methylmalonyl-CoA carboxyltransferase large subunit
MKSETMDQAQSLDDLRVLRQEIARLAERVAALESAAGLTPRAVAPAPAVVSEMRTASPAVEAAEVVSEELILVIGAAVAAFLGKRAHVRQIRLVPSAAWSQQGRVTIQASHALSVHHN